MENYLVTYGFNKDREHLKWICDLCSLHSLQVKKNNWKCDSQEFFERKIASNSKYVVCFKKYSAGKGELNWIVFMAIVKHFRVKMRLASFCCVNLIKYNKQTSVINITRQRML